MTSRAATILGAVVITVASASCGRPATPRGIVLITLDTTRADHLGCYGDGAAETPNLDRLASEATLFREAQSAVPVTFPSHTTMFTGHYPPVHGVRYNGMFHLGDASVTVAELLRDAGWWTAGVPASFPLNERTGIGQGFAVYDDKTHDLDLREARPEDLERRAAEISDIGIRLLRGLDDRPFFVWLHYWDPHFPYDPPFPYSARYRDRPYDGEIAYMDREVGRVFDVLRELGLWDKVLVVVAGDHGEGLYDHGEKMHANLTYQSTLHVPLILKPPGAARERVVEEPVSLADVAPTLLDFAGVPGPAMEGVSLKAAAYGDRPPERDLYFESLAGSLGYGWAPLEGLRRGPWKYVRGGTPELFNLRDDAAEKQNLYGVDGERADRMEARLAALEAGWRGTSGTASPTPTPVDPATLEILASLGYVGGSMAEERRDGPDPRKLIHLELDIFNARDEMRAHDYRAALRRLRGILEPDPTNRLAMLMAATACVHLGDWQGALKLTDRALAAYPEFLTARILNGEVWVHEGNVQRALEVFRAGLDYHPDDTGLSYRIAVALYALDRVAEAQEIADRMIAKGVPEASSFLVLRAACRAKRGEAGKALSDLTAAVEQGYNDRDVLEQEPLLEPLRKLPGFREVVDRMTANGTSEPAGPSAQAQGGS